VQLAFDRQNDVEVFFRADEVAQIGSHHLPSRLKLGAACCLSADEWLLADYYARFVRLLEVVRCNNKVGRLSGWLARRQESLEIATTVVFIYHSSSYDLKCYNCTDKM